MKNSGGLAGLMIVVLVTVSGCTSGKTVTLHQQKLTSDYSFYKSDPNLFAGDIVTYRLINGSHETITVQSTTPQGIITSTGQSIPYKEMISLERKEVSEVKTLAAICAGAALATIALYGFAIGAGFAALVAP